MYMTLNHVPGYLWGYSFYVAGKGWLTVKPVVINGIPRELTAEQINKAIEDSNK